MGHINFPLRDFYDGASELVGIKSGILLNRFKISEFLVERFDNDYLKHDKLDSRIRIGSDEMTNMVIHLRQKVGNMPMDIGIMEHYKVVYEYAKKTGDILVSGLPGAAFTFLKGREEWPLSELINGFSRLYNIDNKLSTSSVRIGLHMADTDITISAGTDWDGGTPLSNLFDMEIKPKSEEDFIEQKFIDYLAMNGHEIEIVHWRNFERFCAEYFKRLGYYAVLGPGSNDGGVDIRVYKSKEELSTSLMLIQCKRYAGENNVTIETVKSFYTDVLFEGAKQGIIATTGYIAPGGKKVCNARKYNISFAEKENIRNWADQMQTK